MKHLPFILSLASALTCFSQTGKLVNIKTEFIKNIQESSLIGNGTHDDADAFLQGLHLVAGTNTLYLPAGTYLLKKEILLYTSGLHIKGAGIGKTIIK